VFENRALRKIFGPKKDEVIGDWKKLHNEELYNSCSPPSTITKLKIIKMRWERYVASM
jgi:hypothetical protein